MWVYLTPTFWDVSMKWLAIKVTIPFLVYACVGGFIVFFSMISLLVKEKVWHFSLPFHPLMFLVLCWGISFRNGIRYHNRTPWCKHLQPTVLEYKYKLSDLGNHAYHLGDWRLCYRRRVTPSLPGQPMEGFGHLGYSNNGNGMGNLSSIYVWAFPGLSVISALCISACLTPTDPVRSFLCWAAD